MLVALLTDLHYGLHLRWEECLRVHPWCASIIEERRPDLIVVAGDLFDRDSKPAERNALTELLRRLGDVAPVLIARGNHDARGDLLIFARLATRHPIRVFEEPSLVEQAGAWIAVLPWMERVVAEESLVGLSAAETMEREMAALREVLVELGTGMREKAGDGPKLFVGHLMLRGAIPRTGQPMKQAKEFELSLADLALIPADAYLLGHVHAAQEWFIGDAPVLYNGSHRRTVSGELEEKYLTFVELGGEDGTRVHRLPTPATPMLLIEDAWIDTPKGWGWRMGAPVGDKVRGAEVRLTYTVPVAQVERARDAAELCLQRFRDAGAVEAIQQARPLVTARSRAPQIAVSHGLADKLGIYLRARGIDPLSRAAEWAYALLPQLQEVGGDRAGTAPAGGLRLHSLHLRGLAPFPDPVELNLGGIEGDIVLVEGENGAGKSTLLNAFPGALFGRTPLGDRLADLAVRDDAMVEAAIDVGGNVWRLQHNIARGKVFVIDPDGDIIDREGRDGRFRAWAREHLVDEDVLLNSTFAPQGNTGIIAQRRGGRKEIVLRAIGAEHLETLAARAREHRASAKSDEREARRRAADDRDRHPAPPPGALETAREEAERAEEHALSTREIYAQGGSARASDEALVVTRRRELVAIDASICRLPPSRSVDVHALEQTLADARREAVRLAGEVEAAGRRRTTASMQRHVAETATLAAKKLGERETAAARLARAEPSTTLCLRQAHIVVDGCRDELEVAERDLRAVEEAIASSPSPAARARHLRSALGTVARRPDLASARATAIAALLADVEHPAPEGDVARAARIAVDDAHARLLAAERAMLGAERRETAEQQAEEAERRAGAAGEEEQRQRAAAQAAALEEQAASAMEGEIREERLRAANRVDTLAAELHDAERAQRANEERGRLMERQAAVAADLATIYERLALATSRPVTTVDLASADAAARVAAERLARLAEATARATAAAERVAAAEQEADDAAAREEGWGLLADAFGRNGIQALEIDAAGPELSAIANDLLQAGCGARWAIEVETMRAKATGEVTEDFLIQVTDAERGTTRDARRFSGGERTILGLSLSLAIAMYVCNRAGAERPTIVRDESDAAVSIGNVEAYMVMVRRAAKMIGAGRVLMVSHGTVMREFVDTILRVDGGRLFMKRPGNV